MNLNKYDLVVINSSGGKDSLCATWMISQLAKMCQYPGEQIVISHQVNRGIVPQILKEARDQK